MKIQIIGQTLKQSLIDKKLYSDSQKNIDNCKQELLKEDTNSNVEGQKQTITDNKNTDTTVAEKQVEYKLYKNRRYANLIILAYLLHCKSYCKFSK